MNCNAIDHSFIHPFKHYMYVKVQFTTFVKDGNWLWVSLCFNPRSSCPPRLVEGDYQNGFICPSFHLRFRPSIDTMRWVACGGNSSYCFKLNV